MSVNAVSSAGVLTPIATRGQFIQYSTMPTPSVDIVDKIVQYVGTTNQNYTNGYFYKCVDNSGSYGWVQENVQPSDGNSGKTLLWENSNPTQAMTYGQIGNITLDSSYDYYLIMVKSYTNKNIYTWHILTEDNYKTSNVDYSIFVTLDVYVDGNNVSRHREFYWDSTSSNALTYGESYKWNDDTSSFSTDNNALIPVKVYGVKL